jgi:predicted transcriptional regulator
MKKRALLQIRISTTQKRQLEKLAKQADSNKSEIIRSLIKEAVEKSQSQYNERNFL